MCNGIRKLVNCRGGRIIDCLEIVYKEGPDSPSLRHQASLDANVVDFNSIAEQCNVSNTKIIEMWSNDSSSPRRIGGRNAAEVVFKDIEEIISYTDIIIDISALPKGLYFPIINKVLYLLDSAKQEECRNLPNLFILVSENVQLDRRIIEVGIDENPTYIHGYTSDLEKESIKNNPVVWIPILGEGRRIQLERIYDFIDPDEICPVLPSPSFNPRRGDDIIIEYHELLFDSWRIEPKNIINGHERNPFEVYRQIKRTIEHYNEVLEPLNSCIAIISADSSKLISLGAFLAAYELKEENRSVGFINVDAQGYEMHLEQGDSDSDLHYELFTLLLDGECHGYSEFL